MALLLATATLAGCSTAGEFHTVSIASEEHGVENGTFYFDGTITISSGAVPPQSYQNVMIVLYNDEKRVIKRVAVGTLSSEEANKSSQAVQFRSKERPRYLVIQSPNFWTDGEKLEVQSYEYVPSTSNYQLYHQTGPNDRFPDSGD